MDLIILLVALATLACIAAIGGHIGFAIAGTFGATCGVVFTVAAIVALGIALVYWLNERASRTGKV